MTSTTHSGTTFGTGTAAPNSNSSITYGTITIAGNTGTGLSGQNYYYYDGTGLINTMSTTNFTLNSSFMENNTKQPQQVQVVVFEIERNEDLEVISTKHVSTLWIEHKPKADLKLVVAKKLAKDVDLDKIVIKELTRITF